MEPEQYALVYEHKTNGMKLVPDGVGLLNEYDLVMILSKHPEIQMVTKPITAGQTTFNIYKADLDIDSSASSSDEEKVKDQTEVPWMVWLGREWEGHSFEQITILFPIGAGMSPTKSSGKVTAEELEAVKKA